MNIPENEKIPDVLEYLNDDDEDDDGLPFNSSKSNTIYPDDYFDIDGENEYYDIYTGETPEEAAIRKHSDDPIYAQLGRERRERLARQQQQQ